MGKKENGYRRFVILNRNLGAHQYKTVMSVTDLLQSIFGVATASMMDTKMSCKGSEAVYAGGGLDQVLQLERVQDQVCIAGHGGDERHHILVSFVPSMIRQ